MITQQLVRLMNGRLDVTSKPGVGTTFYATFLLESAGPTARTPPTWESRPPVFLLAHSDAAARALRHMLQFASLGAIVALERLEELAQLRQVDLNFAGFWPVVSGKRLFCRAWIVEKWL